MSLKLPSGRKVVVKGGNTYYYAADGVELKPQYFIKKEGNIDIRPSGRYSITKNGKTKYYAADGTELKAAYFQKVENPDVIIKTSKGKTYNFNKTLANRINNVSVNLKKAEDENGFIGSAWSGFKNLTGIGDSSDKVRELQDREKKLFAQFNSNSKTRAKVFKQLTGYDYNKQNLEKFINGQISLQSEKALAGYKEGQDMAVDVAADVVSGVAAVGIYTAAVAAAPFTGGGSIAVGVAAAAGSGALIKTGIKYADAKSGGREYTLDNIKHDASTGAVSGALAPVTAGLGGAVGKTVATKLGIQAVKTAGKEVAEESVKTGVKQSLKTALTNPAGYEYVGGNAVKRVAAYGTEMAADGAIGGGVDNAFRTAYDGGSLQDVVKAAGEGFVGGAVLSPLIGGGMKAMNKSKSFVSETQGIQAENFNSKAFTREKLKQKLKEGNMLEHPNITEKHIPKVRLAGPSAKFAETDEAFRNIVRLHRYEFLELNRKSGDDFIKDAFELCKKYMGLDDAPIKLEITNHADSEASPAEAIVRIARNFKGGDKAELLGAIAHELNHMFQYKEMYINSVANDKNYNFAPEFKNWVNKQDEYFANHNQLYYDKGEVYANNFENNYIEPYQSLHAYRNQPVEKESFRRGDIVRDEFNNLIKLKLDKYEQYAAQQILDYFSDKYPNANIDVLQGILDDAITTMKEPEFEDMNYLDFVNYYISLYD